VILDTIVGGILGVVRGILDGVSNALPSISIPSIGPIMHGFAWANQFLPLSEAFDLAVTAVQVLVVLVTVYAAVWALRKIPGLGMS
jgi:hypothetical protein